MCHGCVSLPHWRTHVTTARDGREFYVRRASNDIMAMYNIRILYYGVLLLLAAATSTDSTKCTEIIEGITVPRSNSEGRYHFFMTLFNRTERVYAYMPNSRYSVVLKADSTDQMHRKFTRFLISAEAKEANETADVGVFDRQDDAMTKFADNCANAVMESSKIQKEEISVTWTSPAEGSGCIILRAIVLETTDTWYMDPNLVIERCQDSKAEADEQGPILQNCCACDEAKFEVTFEGLWSRNTHPKDFPSKNWLIRFSDVIGASHTRNYSFWQYHGIASEGLRQVAELGSTRKLESELKNRSEEIRTIIKARGISYPNVTGRTFAVFRVDQKHHLMSLVSMIDPSPDWIVGVSGLELCLPNCSWIEHKQLNLYPYDAGTDNGITYISPDSPTQPKEPIRRITSTYPNDSRSPFYDPSGLDMKPFAKLYLNRQRLYEKTCGDVGDTMTDSEACKVTSWGNWSECSVTCGLGTKLRQRHFHNDAMATMNKCKTPLTNRKTCYNAQYPHCSNSGRQGKFLENEMCELMPWGSWSSCSSTCSKGHKTRRRVFRQRKFQKQCRTELNGMPLEHTIGCENKPCDDKDVEEVRRLNHSNDDEYEEEDFTHEWADGTGQEWLQNCPAEFYTQWSMWSACSASCGPGITLRSRILLHKENLDKDDDKCKMEMSNCTAEMSCDLNFTREKIKEICSEPKKEGNCTGNIIRYYFNKQSGRCVPFGYTGCYANQNNFFTEQDCYKVCGNFQRELKANLSAIMKNLKVSLSSVLSYHIPVQEQRSSKAKRAQHEKENFKGIQASNQIMESSENSKVDCQVSAWSKWSPCENCRGFTMSIRQILIPAENGGRSCPKKLLRKKKCHKVPPCSLQGDGTGRRFHRDKNGVDHEISVDCKVTPWSTWSKCSATCGERLRSRVRSMTVRPRGAWAKLCPTLVEFKNCRRVDCPQ